MPIYSASQLFDKNIWVKKRTELLDKKPDIGGKVIAVAQPGQRVGTFYSYVYNNSNNSYYWMINVANNQFVFFKYEEDLIDGKKLNEQGVLSIEEQRKKDEWANAGLPEKIGIILKDFGGTIKKIVIIGAVGFGTYQLIKAIKNESKQ